MTHPAQAHKYSIVHYTRGNGVEVGGGPTPLYAHFRTTAAEGSIEPGTLDFVFVIDRPEEMPLWCMTVKEGGYVVSIENDVLTVLQAGAGAPRDRSYFTVDDGFPHPCACVVRYGGFGDSIQAANILPELKRQGFFVVFMTLPRGKQILEHDPHIDAWLLQDDNQVPNHELPEFWRVQAKRFDKFVQLSESVEGTLLAYPGRSNHAWPDSVRRRRMGINYLEWTAELAELPYTSEGRFYSTAQEDERAADYVMAMRKKGLGRAPRPMERLPAAFTIMWCLSGSSHHKFYPHQDEVIARVLANLPEALIVFTGDNACRVLEAGWEEHPRITCASGEQGVRETLTLAKQVACVVGPETGVLNAVAFESNGKVIMLSHSSRENLTKHWVNAVTLEPQQTACYPCHRLHFGRDFCPEHSSGAALCQGNIPTDDAYAAIEAHYREWARLRDILQPAEAIAA